MKKILSVMTLIILISIFIIPLRVKAAVIDLSKYKSEDLVTTFNIEGITNYDLTKYNLSNDKRVNIYIFRGDGCINCKNLYTYYIANKLLASHGDKIRIISYEVKNNKLNYGLLNEAKTLINEQASSYATPIMFIGNKTFSGDLVVNNATQQQAKIENAIDDLYNSSNRYDIIEELAGKNVFTDNTTNITLTSATRLDKNYILKVSEVDNKGVVANEGDMYIVSYDISVYNGNVVVPLSNGSFKIRIPVNTKFDNYKVAYVKDGKIQEEFKATYNNNCVEFTTTHLSEYVVYGSNNKKPDVDQDVNLNPDPDENLDVTPDLNKKPNVTLDNNNTTNKNGLSEKNPQTFDMIQVYVILLGLACTTLIVSIILLRKKNI